MSSMIPGLGGGSDGYEFAGAVTVSAKAGKDSTIEVSKRITGEGYIIPHYIYLDVNASTYASNNSSTGYVQNIDGLEFGYSANAGYGENSATRRYELWGCTFGSSDSGVVIGSISNHELKMFIHGTVYPILFSKYITISNTVINVNKPTDITGEFAVYVWKKKGTTLTIT